MRELGSELNRELTKKCPDCGSVLRSGSCRECGWESNRSELALKFRCAICNTLTRIVQLTPGEDGRDRCAACHFQHLKDRFEADPVGLEDLERCKTRIRQSLARMDGKEHPRAPEPSLLERRGVHPMRYRAQLWCVAHPKEAEALGNWVIEIPAGAVL